MRKLSVFLISVLFNVVLSISGYQNPALAAFLLVLNTVLGGYWIATHEAVLAWGRRRKSMALITAIVVGALLGGGIGYGWWYWFIRLPAQEISTAADATIEQLQLEIEAPNYINFLPHPTISAEERTIYVVYASNVRITNHSLEYPVELSIDFHLPLTNNRILSSKEGNVPELKWKASFPMLFFLHTPLRIEPKSSAFWSLGCLVMGLTQDQLGGDFPDLIRREENNRFVPAHLVIFDFLSKKTIKVYVPGRYPPASEQE